MTEPASDIEQTSSQQSEVDDAILQGRLVASQSVDDDLTRLMIEETALMGNLTVLDADILAAEKNISGWQRKKSEAENERDEVASRLAARIEAIAKMKVEALKGKV